MRDIMRDTATAIVNSTAAMLKDASFVAYSSLSSSTHSVNIKSFIPITSNTQWHCYRHSRNLF
jgi:hypothetical protein